MSAPSKIVFWDFDWSLVNENTDEFVIKKCGDEDLLSEMYTLARTTQWTELMDHMLERLHSRFGRTAEDIRIAMSELPIFEHNCKSVKMIDRGGIPQCIVSDSNTVFISNVLESHDGISDVFSTSRWSKLNFLSDASSSGGDEKIVSPIVTNLAYYDTTGRLRVSPYQNNNFCSRCPANMCKGSIVSSMISLSQSPNVPGMLPSRRFERIAYVGDGRNDFCPATLLQDGDYLFVRKGLGLWKLLNSDPEKRSLIKGVIAEWRDGSELYDLFCRFVSEDYVLDK
uniref:Uncharacterized protein n=1 Tax=Corethron hystrix TaxID=216773 RepID=A0A7S1B5K1_9STRA|mmetsp:Transcript_13927/g.30589  ORF Transcript_13927/g.30589 Transcript_13927/m.30589 type:complete len:283 (+) Transcript_13927:59-907(+)